MIPIAIVLVETEGSINLGSVSRLAGNFGADLRLVRVAGEVSTPEAFRMAHPCQELLEHAPRFLTLESALQDVTVSIATSSKLAAARVELDVARARRLLPQETERLALVFGNERTGLSKVDAAKCSRTYSLFTPGPVSSMNLASAVACALTLFAEASRDQRESRASEPARDELLAAWNEALDTAGFYERTSKSSFQPRLAELMSKMDLSPRDTVLMKDMFTMLARRARDLR